MRNSLLMLGILASCATGFGMTIDDLEPGKTVSGPALNVADMHGKVVYVEFWGTR